ncbi:hypothetical protein FYJ74_10675 [Pyramidobacter sp. SM-530-WT-4B]|uniref:Uncharacterized protein n=1 Tax=Pyramidobacter porci TaxID=2605789 RepID=A0A6L5YE59_9BACT|nr:hypothetical protein [Pyramidobacter porci]MDY2649441.1 hypothetical protein [Pyramidobacter porci]MST56489.1 hypothetical protein [Pyramidobacter porci]
MAAAVPTIQDAAWGNLAKRACGDEKPLYASVDGLQIAPADTEGLWRFISRLFGTVFWLLGVKFNS